MDLIDLLRILLRRWYVVLPVVAVAGVGAFAYGENVDPEYTAESTMLLLPPNQPDPVDGAINAYRTIGSDTTIEALEAIVESPGSRQQVADSGLALIYDIRSDSRSNLVSITATDGDAANAVDTVAYVEQAMIAELDRRQDAIPGLLDSQRFVFETLSPPALAFTEAPGQTRVQVAVLGVGGLLAVGLALLVDRVLTGRSNRRARQSAAAADAAVNSTLVDAPLPAAEAAGPPVAGATADDFDLVARGEWGGRQERPAMRHAAGDVTANGQLGDDQALPAAATLAPLHAGGGRHQSATPTSPLQPTSGASAAASRPPAPAFQAAPAGSTGSRVGEQAGAPTVPGSSPLRRVSGANARAGANGRAGTNGRAGSNGRAETNGRAESKGRAETNGHSAAGGAAHSGARPYAGAEAGGRAAAAWVGGSPGAAGQPVAGGGRPAGDPGAPATGAGGPATQAGAVGTSGRSAARTPPGWGPRAPQPSPTDPGSAGSTRGGRPAGTR